MPDAQPYLSVVACSRNDNHGGSLTRRMQIFVNGFIAQCQRHRLPAELILVEWNPPPERQALAKELSWPADCQPCRVRIVTVPPELHRRFQHADNLPLFQMIAKNVGIRRARGAFVLCTNIDILFNDELMAFLSARKLEADKLYRIDRWDADEQVPLEAPVEEQLRYGRTHLLRVATRQGTIPLDPTGEFKVLPYDVLKPGIGLRLGRGWFPLKRATRNTFFRYLADGAELFVEAQADPPKGVALTLEPGPGVKNFPFQMDVLDGAGHVVSGGCVFGRHRLHLALPTVANRAQRYRLRIHGGGIPQEEDGEVRDARVFALERSELDRFELPAGLALPTDIRFVHAVPELILIKSKSRLLAGAEHEPPSFDITRPGDGIRLGRNWYAFEIKDDRYARWVDNDAEIVVLRPECERRTLEIEIESGGGLGFKPFELHVRDESGKIIARLPVRGNRRRMRRHLRHLERRRKGLAIEEPPEPEKRKRLLGQFSLQRFFQSRDVFRVELPLVKGRDNAFTLHVDEAEITQTDQPRLRNFRIYALRWLKPNPRPLEAAVEGFASAAEFLAQNLITAERNRMDPGEGKRLHLPANLHMNACGDFTLLSREMWHKIRGYPELETYSMHIDSLGIHAAHAAGAQEVVLEDPMRAYHIEHSAGSGWTPEGEAKLYARMAEKGIPVIDWFQLLDWAAQMARSGPIAFNQEDWGLGQEELEETNPGG